MSDDYFNIPGLSVSGINAFYKSPLHYWKESPFNPDKITREATPAMLFGSVSHKLALEHHLFDEEFAVAPECDRRTKGGKDAYDAFTIQAEGKRVITNEMYREASELAEALKKNVAVQRLLGNGTAEKPIMWKNNHIQCKAKLDYYREGLVLDYKTSTSASPQDFIKSVVNFGYHRQAAWYLSGIEATYGERPKGFVFIVQDKTLPEAIGIYVLDEEAIRIGTMQNETASEQIAERLQTGQWGAFPELITTIGLPAWYN